MQLTAHVIPIFWTEGPYEIIQILKKKLIKKKQYQLYSTYQDKL
jgi:hypothetical protein